MKAWEVRSGALDLREVEAPAPRSGEIVVQTRYLGICGSDKPKLLRPYRFALPEPWRPGHEIVGTDSAGRWVVVDPLVSCRRCACCAAGDTHLCPALIRIGWDLPGGLAEQARVPATNLYAVPEHLDPLYAVLADPAAVAVHGIRCSPIDGNARLAVVGAGTVGMLTAVYASAAGHAVTVVYREGSPPRAAVRQAIAVEFRAPSQVVAGTFDAVVDAASGHDVTPLELAIRLVRDGGSIVVQNAYHPEVRLRMPLREVFRRSVRLVGSFSYCRHNRESDFHHALALLSDHSDEVCQLIVGAGTLGDLNAVLDCRSSGCPRHVLTVELEP